MKTQKTVSYTIPCFPIERNQKIIGFKSRLETYHFVDHLNQSLEIKLKFHNLYEISNENVSAFFSIFYDYTKNMNRRILLVNKTHQFEIKNSDLLTKNMNTPTLFESIESDAEEYVYYALNKGKYSIYKAPFSEMDYILMLDSEDLDEQFQEIRDKMVYVKTFAQYEEIDYKRDSLKREHIKTWKDRIDEVYIEMNNCIDNELSENENRLCEYQKLITQRGRNLIDNQRKVPTQSDLFKPKG